MFPKAARLQKLARFHIPYRTAKSVALLNLNPELHLRSADASGPLVFISVPDKAERLLLNSTRCFKESRVWADLDEKLRRLIIPAESPVSMHVMAGAGSRKIDSDQ
jgi:hypothetical protein